MFIAQLRGHYPNIEGSTESTLVPTRQYGYNEAVHDICETAGMDPKTWASAQKNRRKFKRELIRGLKEVH